MSNSSTKEMLDKGHNFAFIGLVIALIAFALSIYSSSIAVSPSLNIEVQNTENIEEIKPEENQNNHLKVVVLLLSLGAILNGFLGMLREKQRYMGGAVILVAVSAIIIQYLWITLIILVIVIILAAILLSLGVEF